MIIPTDEDIQMLEESGLFLNIDERGDKYVRYRRVYRVKNCDKYIRFLIPKVHVTKNWPIWANETLIISGEEAFNLLPKRLQSKFVFHMDIFKWPLS